MVQLCCLFLLQFFHRGRERCKRPCVQILLIHRVKGMGIYYENGNSICSAYALCIFLLGLCERDSLLIMLFAMLNIS